MRFHLLIFLLSATFSMACHQPSAPRPAKSSIPPGAQMADVSISDLNYWIEGDRFFVIGICHNESARWQNIWLAMIPLDKNGQTIGFSPESYNTFQVTANAVPPKGRSSFFAFWPLNAFDAPPAACRVSGAGTFQVPPRPILIATETGGIRVLDNKPSGDTLKQIESRWMSNTTIVNPMPVEAAAPRLELLIYGTDNKLWMSTLLDPEDPGLKPVFSMEKTGPMAPGEKRKASTYIYYDKVPARLQEIKIGRVEYLPFCAR
jgi:hypothetical protein